MLQIPETSDLPWAEKPPEAVMFEDDKNLEEPCDTKLAVADNVRVVLLRDLPTADKLQEAVKVPVVG